MPAAARASRSVLSLCCTLLAARGAAEDARPAIFAPAEASQAEPARPVATLLSLSSARMRQLITEQVMARTTPLAPAVAPVGAKSETNAILMERYVVNSAPIPLIQLTPPPPPLARFLTTGTFLHDATGKVHVQGNVNLITIPAVGLRPHDFTRVEVEFRFTW